MSINTKLTKEIRPNQTLKSKQQQWQHLHASYGTLYYVPSKFNYDEKNYIILL